MTEKAPPACDRPASECPIVHGATAHTWRHNFFTMALVGFFIGGTIVGGGWALFIYNDPPIMYLESRLVTPDAVPGGLIRFYVTVRPHVERPCLGTITREFYTKVQFEGRTTRLKKRSPGPPPIVHEEEPPYLVDIDLPGHMELGDWEFQGETAYDCGFLWAIANDFPRGVFNGGVVRLRTPTMPFRVVQALPGK